jgi:Peptidase MA superfamily
MGSNALQSLVAGTLLLAALLLVAGLPDLAHAQEAVQVQDSNARNDFPDGITFTLDVSAPGGVDRAQLVYRIGPDGVRNTASSECAGGPQLSCSTVIEGGRENTLIPGANISYFWRITSDGATTETEPQRFVYEDTRFEWQTARDGNVTVHYYSTDDEGARAVLAAARETIDSMSALLDVTVDFPVKVRLYATAEDMQPAILSDNAEGVVTLGEVVYSDTAMVSADGSPDAITRHEVGHIVERVAAGSFDIPAWLNEGTAVYAQGNPLSGQGGALQRAIDQDDVFTIHQISSASAGGLGNRVELFYGQSHSIVAFMIDEYGEERFAELFAAFDDGATTEEALEQVYGLDQDGLENAWRESVGLPPRESPPDEAEAPTPGGSSSDDASDAVSEGGGTSVALLIGIGALTVLLAGSLLGAGVYIARRG